MRRCLTLLRDPIFCAIAILFAALPSAQAGLIIEGKNTTIAPGTTGTVEFIISSSDPLSPESLSSFSARFQIDPSAIGQLKFGTQTREFQSDSDFVFSNNPTTGMLSVSDIFLPGSPPQTFPDLQLDATGFSGPQTPTIPPALPLPPTPTLLDSPRLLISMQVEADVLANGSFEIDLIDQIPFTIFVGAAPPPSFPPTFVPPLAITRLTPATITVGSPNVIPEPSSGALWGLAVIAGVGLRRRRNRTK